MTSPADVIAQLLLGRPEVAGSLLAACRTHAYGAEAFGGVMACQMFARQPAPLSRQPHIVATAQNLAIFDADAQGAEQAIFADLYDGHIGRIWRLGGGETDCQAEPALVIAVDTMLSQLRSDVALSPSDHPNLDPAAVPALRKLAGAVASMDGNGQNTIADGRAFVIRAFSDEDRGAALLAVAQPAQQTIYAAVSFRFAGSNLTHSRIIFESTPKPASRLTLMPSSA